MRRVSEQEYILLRDTGRAYIPLNFNNEIWKMLEHTHLLVSSYGRFSFEGEIIKPTMLGGIMKLQFNFPPFRKQWVSVEEVMNAAFPPIKKE
jgi:hypothetical protein